MAGTAAVESQPNFQTARLAVGRHEAPGSEVCVMELASMIAGERFSDRPASVCPVIGSILRAYNDNLDDRRRGDLYRYAAEAVGTRGSFPLQLSRAGLAIEWARHYHASRARLRRALRRPGWEPQPDDGPDQIARYLIGSLGRGRRPGAWPDEMHAAVLELIDDLIELGLTPSPSVGKFVEQVVETVEDRDRVAELVV